MSAFDVEYTVSAIDEIEESFRWIHDRAPMAAEKWREELISKIDSLADNPLTCPVAPESSKFTREIRLMLFRKKRSQIRIYYTINDRRVVILAVRRVFRKPLDTDDFVQ